MSSEFEEAFTAALKKAPGNRGAAKALLMDRLQRHLGLDDEKLMTAVGVIVEEVLDEGALLDSPEALIAEVTRRARRSHLRLVK